MKMTKREKSLLILLITVISAIVLLFAFIVPTNIETNITRDNISNLKNDIEEAINAEMMFNLMSAQMVMAEENFIEKTDVIVPDLDDSQALRILHGVFSLYTDDISLTFPEVSEQTISGIAILPIEARISVPSYSALRSILSELTLEKSGCVVFDLSYRQIGGDALSVTMRILFLKGK